MVEEILNNTTPYGKIRASHEGSLHSSTLNAPDNAISFDLTYSMLCRPVYYILTGFVFKCFLFRDSYLSF